MISVMTCYYKSEYVGFETSFTVLVPQKKHIRCASSPRIEKNSFRREYPLLILLHDEAEGQEEWMHMTSLCRYAGEQGIVVVMPNCNRSFYSDYEIRDNKSGEGDTNIKALQEFTELMYESYIAEELVPYVQRMFPVSAERGKTFIGGKGMGGFGALKLALGHPDLFGALFSVSGLADLQWAMDHLDEKKEQFEAVFGGLKVRPGGKEDFGNRIKVLAEEKRLPRIFMAVNRGHVYEESNRIFLKEIQEYLPETEKSGHDAVILSEEPELTWEYLDRLTPEILSWLSGKAGAALA